MNSSNQKSDDRQFFDAHLILVGALENKVPQDKTDEAARIAMDYCLRSGDRLAWAFLLARFEDFVRDGKTPPAPMLLGLADVFCKFRSGGTSMDAAFGLKQSKRGAPKETLRKREWARTNASMVNHELFKGHSLSEAYALVASFRDALHGDGTGDSISKIARDHDKYGVNKPK